MRSVATDVAVAWPVYLCVLVTLVRCAKMAELIEMPFGMHTHVAPRTHVLDCGPDPQGNGKSEGDMCRLKSTI